MGSGQGSVVERNHTGFQPVGLGGLLGSSPRGSVTVGLLLVLEGASVDFRLSFAPDATSEYSQQELAQVLRNYILLSYQNSPIRSIKVVIRR